MYYYFFYNIRITPVVYYYFFYNIRITPVVYYYFFYNIRLFVSIVCFDFFSRLFTCIYSMVFHIINIATFPVVFQLAVVVL